MTNNDAIPEGIETSRSYDGEDRNDKDGNASSILANFEGFTQESVVAASDNTCKFVEACMISIRGQNDFFFRRKTLCLRGETMKE